MNDVSDHEAAMRLLYGYVVRENISQAGHEKNIYSCNCIAFETSNVPLFVHCADLMYYDKLRYSVGEKALKELKEALKLLKAIHCQFIVRLIGIVNEEGQIGIVMEYSKYGDLKDFLKYLGGDCWPRRVRMLLDIASGISHMHGLVPPLVHRDIKLSNIMIDGGYKAKVNISQNIDIRLDITDIPPSS